MNIIKIPVTIINFIIMITQTSILILSHNKICFNSFKIFTPIYILNGISGIILIDIHKDKIKNIVKNKNFNIVSYIPNYSISTFQYFSFGVHTLLIVIPTYIIYFNYINLNEIINLINIIKSMILLSFITLLYKVYIYPDTIKKIYLL